MASKASYKPVPVELQDQPSPGIPSPSAVRGSESSVSDIQALKTTPTHYEPTQEELDADPLERVVRRDTILKKKIRALKVVSRLTAASLSLAVLVPLSITLHKFLATNKQYRTVTNESLPGGPVTRTAWALQTKEWPHYLYFTLAILSLAFNLAVLLGYLHSIRSANRAATVGSVFSAAELLTHLVIWLVTVSIYKHEAVVTEAGKHNDLWGWTCSPAAKALQPVFSDVIDFAEYCGIQGASWYIGLVQVAASVLTLLLYLLAIRRLQSKEKVRRSMLLTRTST